VLDGAELAASAIHARRVVAYVPEELARAVWAAVQERERAGVARHAVEVAVAPPAYLAGEESAVAAHLSGGLGALPTFTGLHPVFERGVEGRPTLVHNVETLAHVALVVRFGPAWFRRVGTERCPGSPFYRCRVRSSPRG
jgi:NADH:ubiquinone oxidoreductase subunit F (NADH-binding)